LVAVLFGYIGQFFAGGDHADFGFHVVEAIAGGSNG
jgi:hypothetical protein